MSVDRHVAKALREYVKGGLSDEAQLDVEERLIKEPELFDALSTTEQEFIDEYLDESLTRRSRRAFEHRLLVAPHLRRRLSFARLLRDHATNVGAKQAEDLDHASTPWMVRVFQFQNGWAAAAAALLVVVIGLGGVILRLTVNRSSLQAELTRAQAQQQIEQQQVARLSTDVQELQSKLRSEEQRAETGVRPRGGPAVGDSRPTWEAIPTYSLRAGILRGGSPLTTVTISKSSPVVRLRLEIEDAPYDTYRAVLYRTETDEELWSQSKLRAQSREPVPLSVVITLPVEVLASGEYQLTLSGTRKGQGAELIATYGFRVTFR